MTTEQKLKLENLSLQLRLIETSIQFLALQRNVVGAELNTFREALAKEAKNESEKTPAPPLSPVDA